MKKSILLLAFLFMSAGLYVIGKAAKLPYYRYINEGDPLIVSENARDLGFKSLNQSFQLSVCYALK